MSKHSKSESEQLELYGPKLRSVMEPAICAERTMNDLINAVAVCCVQGLKGKGNGGTFEDAKRIARRAFLDFVASPKDQTEDRWSDFFVKYVQGLKLGIDDSSLNSLRKRLENLNQKHRILDLFEIRAQLEAILESKPNELTKESIDKIRVLRYDLTFPHI